MTCARCNLGIPEGRIYQSFSFSNWKSQICERCLRLDDEAMDIIMEKGWYLDVNEPRTERMLMSDVHRLIRKEDPIVLACGYFICDLVTEALKKENQNGSRNT